MRKAASTDSQPAKNLRYGTTSKKGIIGTRSPHSFFVSLTLSPQFLRMFASSREIVSWVL